MADRRHGIGGKRPGGSPVESGSAAPAPSMPPRPPLKPPGPPLASEPGDRPGAAGHRFGPRLVCSECGIRWDVHQRDRKPCVAGSPAGVTGDPFSRRPVLPLPAPDSSDSPEAPESPEDEST